MTVAQLAASGFRQGQVPQAGTLYSFLLQRYYGPSNASKLIQKGGLFAPTSPFKGQELEKLPPEEVVNRGIYVSWDSTRNDGRPTLEIISTEEGASVSSRGDIVRPK
jgi:hypothetical protein